MSDSDRGQQRPGQTPPNGAGGAPAQRCTRAAAAGGVGLRPCVPTAHAAVVAALAAVRDRSRSELSAAAAAREPAVRRRRSRARAVRRVRHGQQPPRVPGPPNQPPQPFPSGVLRRATAARPVGPVRADARSVVPAAVVPERRSRAGTVEAIGRRTVGQPPSDGQPNGPARRRTATAAPNWGAPAAAKPKLSLRERLGLTKPASEKSGRGSTPSAVVRRCCFTASAPIGGATDWCPRRRPSDTDSADPDRPPPRSTRRSSAPPESQPAPVAKRAAGWRRSCGGRPRPQLPARPLAASGAAAAGATQPAARQAPIGTPVRPRPDGADRAPSAPAHD